jgi:DNA-binding transcriptional ArsR family regulator
MMWPLLADLLRDAKSGPTFSEMLETIASFDDATFQRAVMGGVFRSERIVDELIAGRQSLRDAVLAESGTGNRLLSLMGLYPFRQSSRAAGAFTRIVSDPANYRTDLSNALEIFWDSAFSDDWKALEPHMKRRVEAMEEALGNNPLSAFSRDLKLPVIFDDRKKIISAGDAAPMFRYRDLRDIYVIPSAFNDLRFWGAYADSAGSLRLYFPVFDPELLETATIRTEHPRIPVDTEGADPALIFRALGDTTRYAMACILARSPRTSVGLAKEFGVSKATISHHVQVLRNAGLLQEKVTERGVVLTLDRQAIEKLGTGATRAMFASDHPPVIKRSRHEPRTRKSAGERKESESSSPGEKE